MSSSVYANNKTKNILILGEGITQGLDDTTQAAEKMYLINFTVSRKKFCLSLHYNGDNSYLLVDGREIIEFKAEYSEVVASPLCLGNISKDFSVANMKKLDYMDLFLILVLIMMLLQSMIYLIFTSI